LQDAIYRRQFISVVFQRRTFSQALPNCLAGPRKPLGR
jgi:hypothetical protein